MWSTSPAESTVIVPPLSAPCTGAGVVVPVAWLLLLLDPQAVATSARVTTPAAAAARAIRWRDVLGCSRMSFLLGSCSVDSPRVQSVADAVAEQVEGQHRQQQRRSRKDEE